MRLGIKSWGNYSYYTDNRCNTKPFLFSPYRRRRECGYLNSLSTRLVFTKL